MSHRFVDGRRRRLIGLAAFAALPLGHASEDPRFGALRTNAQKVRHPSQVVLQAVANTGQRLVAVGERGVIALSDDVAKTWRQASQVPTSVTLTGVAFADPMHGWAVGHCGVVLATEDGGEKWTKQADGQALSALAQSVASQRPERPALQKEAAQLVADGPDKPLLDLHVFNAGHLVVVGAYNLIFESHDGGRTWQPLLDRMDNPKGLHINAVAVQGDQWMLAGEQGLLMRSQDGGRSFQRMASPYAGSWFGLASAGQDEWIVAGLRGHVLRSTDRGNTWSALEGAPPANIVSVQPLKDGTALFATQAGQLLTSKAGSRLEQLTARSLPPLTQATMLPNGDLLALSMLGALHLPGKVTS